jgi:CRISP-associated protein Cas1
MTTNRPKTDPPLDGAPARERPKHLPLVGISRAQPPLVVPARMLNEVMYCERLMYLEWVQGEFADNYFTIDGRHVHDRADSAGGRLPSPRSREEADDDASQQQDAANPYQARSVWLTSESLGITAKIDIVEGDASGKVTPVEYKRGAVPDLPEGAYIPERVQLCAHVLLLREQGYVCDGAEIYFAKSKRRVPIAITDDLIQTTLWAARVAREVAARTEPPPPLLDSPKCRGCSLAGICLPDEVNLMRRLEGQPILEPPAADSDLVGPLDPDPWGLVSTDQDLDSEQEAKSPIRRLYAALDERVPLYVHDPRAQIGLAGERLWVRGEDATVHVRLMNTSQVVLRGNVQLTTQAARALLDRGIPVTYLSGGGWYSGRLAGTDTNNIDLRIAQFRMAQDQTACLDLARSFVVAKLRNSRTLLRRNHPAPDPVVLGQLKQLSRKAAAAESSDSLLGLEGAGAREYFRAFSGVLHSPDLGTFDFERRNRRPPRDPVNALLSFVYALLTKECVIAVAGVGFEPLLGFYHKPRFGRPALALDMMEEFRPLIADSVVMTVINTGVVRPHDFTVLGDACSIKAPARAKVIEAYERRMDQTVIHPLFGYSASYRRILELQARLLSRVITGELPRYQAFTTR